MVWRRMEGQVGDELRLRMVADDRRMQTAAVQLAKRRAGDVRIKSKWALRIRLCVALVSAVELCHETM